MNRDWAICRGGAPLVVLALMIGCAATPVDVATTLTIATVPAGQPLLPAFERIELNNGTVVMLAPKRDVPLVAMSAILRGGAVTDDASHSGLAALTAGLLEKGAGSRSAATFVDAVAAVGGQLSSGAGLESVQIDAEFLTDDTDLMIELFGDMLKAPRFDQDEFDKLRSRTIESLKAARDGDPRGLVSNYGRAFLFEGHPYGKPTGGTEVSLARLTLADVKRHYAEHYGADRLIISVVGDFDVPRVRAALSRAFGDWRRAPTPLPSVAPTTRQAGGRVLLIDKPDATQTYFWLANVGVARRYEHRAALDVANTIFGGRFTSLLNTALRIESGLTYGASSRLSRPTQPGSVALVSFTANDTTIDAIDLARQTLQTFRTSDQATTMIDSAKTYLRGQNPLTLETAGQVAGQLSSLAFYDLDRDHVDGYGAQVAAVDAAALRRVVAEVYPSNDELVMVLIGKADAIRDDVARYGRVTEMSISEPRFAPEK